MKIHFAVLSIVLCTATAVADTPSVSYIFPAGGQRGTTIDVRVGGHYLHDTCHFEMLGYGIDGPSQLTRAKSVVWFEGPVIPLPASQQQEDYPWEHEGVLAIAANARLGPRRWRVWTSQGVTPTMKFLVGDLPEVVEQEVDGDPLPAAVRLPVTINGRIFPREDIDIWTFAGRAGRSYTCEVVAARLGSPLDSRLAVIGPDGQAVAENIDGFAADSFLRFTAPSDGNYQVRIHDVEFGGLQHYVYRLTITDGPHVESLFPLGGRRGTTTRFRLFGQSLPAEPILLGLPDSPDDFYQARVEFGGQPANPFLVELGSCQELLEQEPNDLTGQALLLAPPAVGNGCVDRSGDVDCWRFSARGEDTFEVDLRAARLGSRLDSVISIVDAGGKEVASADDIGKGDTDSRLVFQAPADGDYYVKVRDRFASRGGLGFGYRLDLKIQPDVQPDFELRLAGDAVTLNRGAQVKFKVTAARKGGFSGPIALDVQGLPEGVTVSGGNAIADQKNETELVLSAAPDCPIQVARLSVAGSATVGQMQLLRRAVLPASTPNDLAVDHLLLAVALPTPFKVVGEFETRYGDRGGTFVRHYAIERGGYEGPLTVRLAERQVRHLQGVSGPSIVVPPGTSAFDYPIQLPPWMEIGRTSRTCVMAVAEIEDETGAPHKVSYTSHAQNDQIIVLVDPGQLDVRVDRKSLLAVPGETARLGVRIGRGKGMRGPVQLEVVIPRHIHGVSSQAITLASDEESGSLAIHVDRSGIGPLNMPLTVRATASRDGHPYTAEESVALVSVGGYLRIPIPE